MRGFLLSICACSCNLVLKEKAPGGFYLLGANSLN
jgi:hypothetical protein